MVNVSKKNKSFRYSVFIRTARIYSLIPMEIRKNTPKMFSELLAMLDISTILNDKRYDFIYVKLL